MRPAHDLIAESSRIMAEAASKATGKGTAPGVTEEAFKEAWSALNEAAQTLLKEVETALDTVPERMQLQPTLRDALVAHLEAQLQLALMPTADVIKSVQEATRKPKPKAAKEGKSKDAGSGSGRGRKVQIKPELLKSAYAKLRQFQYGLLEACAGKSQAYLLPQELKQLTIDSGVYDANNNNKMKMIAALMKPDTFMKVKSSAAAAAALMDQDGDDGDEGEEGEEGEEDETADKKDDEEEDSDDVEDDSDVY